MSSDDIVERLRQSDGFRTRIYDDGLPAIVPDTNLMHEAADEIEWLRAAGTALLNAKTADETVAAEAEWHRLMGWD